MKILRNKLKSSDDSLVRANLEIAVPILTFFSGAAALIYESLWMRSFGLIFGNTTYAITVILSTYMFGIALGSYFIGKMKINRPLRLYIIVEAGIGISAFMAFLLLQILPGIWGGFLQKIPLSAVLEVPLRIIFSGSIILIPTLLMGATVPLLVQILSRQKSRHAALSRLYSMNTLGGAIGVLLSIFILFPSLGLSKTYNIAIAINLLVALICILFIRSENASPLSSATLEAQSEKIKISKGLKRNDTWVFNIVAALVGGTSFCLEILWSRSFVLVIGSSIYAFNLMLFSFLLGLVLGSWIYEKVWSKIQNPVRLLIILLFAIGTGILGSVLAIGRLPLLYLNLMQLFPVSFGLYQIIGFFLCFIVMVILTTAFGFTFPLLLRLLGEEGQKQVGARKATARLYAWNTFGTIMGTLITGFVLVPFLGLQKSYICIAVVPFLMGLLLMGKLIDLKYSVQIGLVTVVLAGFFFLFSFWKPWEPEIMTSGIYKYGLRLNKQQQRSTYNLLKNKEEKKIIFYKESIEGVVSVFQKEKNETYLVINGKTDGGTSDHVTQKFLAYVPLVLHPDPKRALVIGWGTGCTAGVAGLFPIKTLDAVEIEPEVFNASPLFKDINRKVYFDKRLKMIFRDGRNVLLTTPYSYDVIIAEPSNPWITGVSNLFTQDFYKIGLSRLAEQGIFCQWFHIYDVSLDVLQSQIKTFCSVFPSATLWTVPPDKEQSKREVFLCGDILLIGSRTPVMLDMSRVGKIYSVPNINEDLTSMGIENPLLFSSNLILDREALLRFSDKAQLNTDDYPYIEFNAPRGLFQTDTGSQMLLLKVYKALQAFDTAAAPPVINNPILSSPDYKNNLALSYQQLGKLYIKRYMFGKAERLFIKSLQLNSNLVESAEALAWINDIENKYQASIYWYQKAITINPKRLLPWEKLASLYYYLGNMKEAKEVYGQIMLAFPNEAVGAYGIGVVYFKEQNYPKALIYLRKALERDSSLTPARKMLKSIENL